MSRDFRGARERRHPRQEAPNVAPYAAPATASSYGCPWLIDS